MPLTELVKSIPHLIKKAQPDKKHLEKVYSTQRSLRNEISTLQQKSQKPLDNYSWSHPYIHKGNLTKGYRVRFYNPEFRELVYASGKIQEVNPDGTYKILTKTRNPDRSSEIEKIIKIFPSVPKANIYFIFPNQKEVRNGPGEKKQRVPKVKQHKNLTPQEATQMAKKNSAEIAKLLKEKEATKDDKKRRAIRKQLRSLGYFASKQPGYDPSKFLEKARANNPKLNKNLKKKKTEKVD